MWIIYNDEEREAIHDLHTASDRAAAILGGTLLENRLEMAIQLRMAEDKEVLTQLFRTSGPLGSFSAKIDLGYLMKMYGKEARHDLVLTCH